MSGWDGGDDRFEKIYRRFYARVWRYFRSCRVSDDEAHDLAQDTFTSLFKRMGTIRSENEWPFLQSIARTVFLNSYRAGRTQKRDVTKVVDLDDPGIAASAPVSEQPDLAMKQQTELRLTKLRDAIATLPNGQKQCMEWWLSGLSYTEIGRTLGITLDAVKSRIRDAKRTLSAQLGVTLPEDDE